MRVSVSVVEPGSRRNVNPYFGDGHFPPYNSELVRAVEFDAPDGLTDQMVLDLTFHNLNADNALGFGNLSPAVIAAYHRQYPSLSVGDVVRVDRRSYVCAPTGWKVYETWMQTTE